LTQSKLEEFKGPVTTIKILLSNSELSFYETQTEIYAVRPNTDN